MRIVSDEIEELKRDEREIPQLMVLTDDSVGKSARLGGLAFPPIATLLTSQQKSCSVSNLAGLCYRSLDQLTPRFAVAFKGGCGFNSAGEAINHRWRSKNCVWFLYHSQLLVWSRGTNRVFAMFCSLFHEGLSQGRLGG